MPDLGKIAGIVRDDSGHHGTISGARVTAIVEKSGTQLPSVWTNSKGEFQIPGVPDGTYILHCRVFELETESTSIHIAEGRRVHDVVLKPKINLTIKKEGGRAHASVGTPVELTADKNGAAKGVLDWNTPPLSGAGVHHGTNELHITPTTPGVMKISVTLSHPPDLAPLTPSADEVRSATRPEPAAGAILGRPPDHAQLTASMEIIVDAGPVTTVAGKVGVTLGRTTAEHTLDQALWVAIRNRTRAISFPAYQEFIDRVLCREDNHDYGILRREVREVNSLVHGVGAFQVLKAATEAFLIAQCGVFIKQGYYDSSHDLFEPEEESRRFGDPVDLAFVQQRLSPYLGNPPQLPYISRVIAAAFPGLKSGSSFCESVLTANANDPCLLELIWSYWHEEGMLVQSMNAISRRFQNVRGPGDRDPLAHLEIDPLRPLNHLLWGYIQDEPNLLTVRRRAYEYDHHYGLTLYGKAVAPMRTADSRSKFIEAFHNLLHLTSIFFKEDNDTTVIADGYPLLNALREVHLLLAQGAHNQFGDLPWTARAEMLMQEWLMARSEMREFMQSRIMVPYKEGWMPQVDTMKTMQGWSDLTVTHFRDLGVWGEQLLLTIRYGDWIDVNDENAAKNWARYWRPEIQGYLHAYRAVTGIDLTNPDTVDATMPAIHLQKRLAVQQRGR